MRQPQPRSTLLHCTTRFRAAQNAGLEGKDLTAGQVEQLDEAPHPETGQNAKGEQVAPPTAVPAPAAVPAAPPAPAVQQVTIGGKPFEVSQQHGMWFFRRVASEGWTMASRGTADAIDQQLKTTSKNL